MKTTRWSSRLLSLLLAACMILSLIPATLPDARAEESTATEEDPISAQTAELVGQLTNAYSSFGIPIVENVDISKSNVNSLEGYYFMTVGCAANGFSVIDYSKSRKQDTMRLTANSPKSQAAASYWHLTSAPATVSNTANPTALLTINGSYPKNLDYAVEIVKNRASVKYYTGAWEVDANTKGTGWDTYTNWEYKRENSWSANESFGPYLAIHAIHSRSDTAYNIRSLHPSRLSDPWLSCADGSGQMAYSASPYPFFVKPHNSAGSAKIYKVNAAGTSEHTYWLGWDSYNGAKYITAHTISQIVREDRNMNENYEAQYQADFNMNWDFFRISGLTVELFRALDRAKSYALGNNPGASAELYLEFLQLTKQAMDEYTTYRNVVNNNKTDPTRIRLDLLAKELESLTELLPIEADPTSYADIPLEILDFRADGLLFENKNSGTAYALSSASPATVNGANRPGEPKPGDNNVSYMKDLIERQLVGGKIVYRKETVDYIAAALAAKHHTFGDASIDFGENYMDAYYNKTFMDMVDNGILKDGVRIPMTKGDYYETLGKTTTHANGGELAFSQVETYYDLAYYMLTYIWRQTPSDDIVETVEKDGKTHELPYNKKITEIDTIRLIKNSDGEYIFSSNLENGRHLNSGIIYNYKTFRKSDWREPKVNSASGLGFESDDVLGINTTGANEGASADVYHDRNYHVVYHMESAFVYYESKNLHFTFSGDDDVYFFINNQLVCDIGGLHSACTRSISLNGAIAQDLGLEDGDICSFDMYLAERKITGLNLNFQTNIELIPANAVAEKVQYAYTEAGSIGTEIREGAIVSDNTEVGYGLKLLNRSKYGVTEPTLWDDALGVNLSKDKVSLGSSANVEDLIFLYNTYEPTTVELYTNPVKTVDYELFCQTLAKAVSDVSTITPMEPGSYRLTGLNEDQVKALLSLGLPASVQLAVYGFHRTVYTSVGSYTNTLYTTCRPITGKNSDGTYIYGDVISSSAHRTLSVKDMKTVTAKPLQLVVDYGKSVDFSFDDILNCLSYHPLDATVTYQGIRTNGAHGSITMYAPGNLRLKTVDSIDDVYNVDTLDAPNGVYTRWGDSFRFTPTGIMNHIDHAYAVFKIDDSLLGATWYLMVGIDIVPATMMYYEAEELAQTGDLTLEEKTADTVNNEFTVVSDTEDTELPSINKYDPTNDQKVLYFGFENTEADRLRYINNTNNPIYGNTNFDLSSSWVSGYGQVGTVANGIIGFTSHNTTGTWAQFYTTSGYPLKFIPSDNDWIEVRMKLVLANPGSDDTIVFCPEIYTDVGNGGLRTRPWETFKYSEVGNDFFVLKFPIAATHSAFPSSFHYADLSIIRRISLTFESLETNTAFAVDFDYFYIGPEETCPSNLNSDFLYIGFDNTAADQYRYDNPIYGGKYNFDKAPTSYGDSWVYTSTRTTAFAVSDSAMTVTCGTAGGTNTNSPYIQTGLPLTNTILNYPTDRAEIAQVKLKLSNLTTDVTADTEMDHPVARMMFMYRDESSGTDMYCHTDWDLTEAQLNGCDYMTLTADIGKLLADHNVKNITSVRLTLLNAAAISGKTGTFTVDYIYVGPKPEQNLDSYIAAPDSVPPLLPARESYTPNYDDRVLFFDFDGTGATRYATTNGNLNYGSKNFDALSNWYLTNYSSTLSGQSISNGALNFSVAPDNAWCAFGTLNASALNYTPSKDDWIEIRMSISGASGTATGMDVELSNSAGKMTKCSHSFGAAKGGTGFFVASFHLDSAPKHGTQSTSEYTALGTIVKLTVLPTGLKAKTKITLNIDYIYIGPKEHRPSEQKRDYLYFGFENDEAAQYKYTNEVYGANYDDGNNWAYNVDRSSAPSVANGVMSATVTSAGHAWFDTKIARAAYRMNYDARTAQEVQVRVRFTGLKTANNLANGLLQVGFFEPADHAVDTWAAVVHPIPGADVATNGKWFTYRIKIGSELASTDDADTLRIRFSDIVSADSTAKVEVDYIYVGPSLEKEPVEIVNGNSDPYGYDALYADDAVYSDHKTIFAEGKGVPTMAYKTDENGAYVLDANGNKTMVINYSAAKAYTEAEFSFIGTGFDIISRTGVDQGSLRVVICDTNGNVKKTVSVINKGITELYQIPVVSVNDLSYGAYTVKVFVNAAYDYDDDNDPANGDKFDGALDRGGEFYFDALRIYNPINASESSTDADEACAYSRYEYHGESKPTFKELRDILIDASKSTSSETMEGVLYLDTKSGETSNITEYASVGPNNEVYLAAGNAIAFKLEVDGMIPASIDIAAKSADGNAVTMSASIATSASAAASSEASKNITTAAVQYYPLEIDSALWQSADGKSYVYVTIANSGENGTLSISDIKYAYGPATTAMAMSRSLRFVIDREMIGQYADCEHTWDVGTVVCEATCTQAGKKVYACSVCGGTRTEEIAQLEHSYVDGTCICGAVESTDPIPDENLKFNMAITVGAEMNVGYTFMAAPLAKYESFYLEVNKNVAGYEPLVTIFNVDELKAITNPSTGEALMYNASYTGINAKEMGDAFTATLYAVDENGKVYCGPTQTASIKSYLIQKMSAADATLAFKTMAVDMLKYGAAAQVRLNYNTENLVTADLTEEQLSYATKGVPDATDCSAITGSGVDINTSVLVATRVELGLSCIYSNAADPSAVKCVITDTEGNVLAELATQNIAGVMYSAIYDNVGAKQMRQPITATFYDGETAISKTLTWSVESYVAQTRAKENVTEAEVNMVNAMLAYGDSVAAYLLASGQ